MGTSLKSINEVKAFLKRTVESSVKKTLEDAAIGERETQNAVAEKTAEEPVEKEQKPASKDEKLKPGHVELDDVVSELNSIRSGKSLKNPDILVKMTEYFEHLDENERVTLYAFLKGISQILTSEIDPEAATDNDDIDPGMKIEPVEKSSEEKTAPTVAAPAKEEPKAVAKKVVKQAKPATPSPFEKKAQPLEDTTPPKSLPIKPKRRA